MFKKWFLIVIGVAVVGAAIIISLAFFFLDSASSRPANTSTGPNQAQQHADVTCPKTLDMDPQTPIFNKTGVECVQSLIETCRPGSDFLLTYQFGSLATSIQGIKNDGNCSMKLVHEIEMGTSEYNCQIPSGKLAKWQSWRNAGGGDAIKDVSSYCRTLVGNDDSGS